MTTEFPRYTNWRTDTMQSDQARMNIAAFTADDERVRALHDESHPGHRQANADFLMCLDKGDIVSRYQLLEMQMKSQLLSQRTHHEQEVSQLRALVGAAGEWWNTCVKARRAGRKTIQIALMPEGDRG